MKRYFLMMFVFLLSVMVKAQDVIAPTHPLKDKIVLVMPNINANQIQELKNAFQNNSQIIKATYVYKNHNCLLIDFDRNGSIGFYSDILKIIQSGTTYNTNDIAIKTPEAYTEILGKVDDLTNVTVK